jgi:hypothetical protein
LFHSIFIHFLSDLYSLVQQLLAVPSLSSSLALHISKSYFSHTITIMFTNALLLSASLAALVLSEPIPQAAATTDNLAAMESSALASLASLTTDLPGLPSIYSDLPTLPASIESVLETAVPTSVLETEDPCAFVTDAPQWYNSLPANVKAALTSYESALVSWSKEHSAALASMNSGFTADTTGSMATGPALVCTSTGAPAAGGKTTSSGAAKNTGTATGAGAGAGSTGTVGSSSSKGAAPRATGAVAVGLSGVVGVLGLMAAL